MLPDLKKFQNQLRSGQLGSVFEHLPGIYFVVKDLKGRVMMANSFASNLCGLPSVSEMIGKTDHDLFAKDQADSYVADDQTVYETGEAIIDRIELAPDPRNSINWFVTTKLPLYSKNGKVIGLACIGRDLAHAKEELRPYSEMGDALEYVRKNYASQIKIETLAKLTKLSTGQFQRRFRQTFKISPATHITNVRIQSACHLLANSNDTVATIAQEVGFYDHSHFTRSFKKLMGLSPSEYRQKGQHRHW
ncbi:AraC family transcriptional regulator [Pelagicoccus mobilis]|uniref:AraC family transcriptional regulator n=1 Tax=Pelagicoccus mobilis TaxID=415221 RepID=A0A934RR24_9BACT|nr:AraC family transcriptional regulator [Pelagicoccus mobilis]MBK1875980.1 AraC family transcriptional regulator [Pelagicoccus mobilis]